MAVWRNIAVKLLLDTHVFVWFATDDPQLSLSHKLLIDGTSNQIFVSAVSGWEIAIKVKLGKWPEAAPLLPGLSTVALRAGLRLLDVTLEQAEYAGSLPLIRRDPFDRFLAAQALLLDMPVATVDPAFKAFVCKTV